MLITLASDLLVGVGVGLILKMALHLRNGVRLNTMFKAIVREQCNGSELTLFVHEAAIFTSYLGSKTRPLAIDESIKTVTLNFENAWIVGHGSLSSHDMAGRRKARPAVAS